MAHDHEIYMTLVDTAVELGDVDALHKYTPALEELAQRDNHTLYLAIAHRALGVMYRMTGEYTASESRLREALVLFTQLGTRWQMGRTLFELGELIRGTSFTDAREYYLQALGHFGEIQAAPNVERTHTALSSLA